MSNFVIDKDYRHYKLLKMTTKHFLLTVLLLIGCRVQVAQAQSSKIDIAFDASGMFVVPKEHFKVSGDGVTYNTNTGVVTATGTSGTIYVEINNGDLSKAKSVKLNVERSGSYQDICGTGQIYDSKCGNQNNVVNSWYGSRYGITLNVTASINNVPQGYIWNTKTTSVTKFQWNINKAGSMKIRDLVITSEVSTGIKRRPIDNRHPMWMVHIDVWNQADPQKIINLIPEDIRPYVCMNLSLSCSYDTQNDLYRRPFSAIRTYKSWASVCQQNGLWFTTQPASGGHTHIQDNDLETFEYFFKRYPNFLGWNYAEQFWGFDEPNDKSSSPQSTRLALFAKLVKMHHDYGGFLTISFCGNKDSHPLNPVGMLKRNADLLAISKQYPDAILWLYKYTMPACFYNDESVCLGPYLSGLTEQYGVRYDNCGYNDAITDLLFTEDDKKASDYNERRNVYKYPSAVGIGTVMEQTALNGGAVWDGPELIWTEDFQNLATSTTADGYMQRNWGTFSSFRNIWIDMFRKVIQGKLYIPSQNEVIAKTKVIVEQDVRSGTDQDKYASWNDLYDNLYKTDDPFNKGDGYMNDNHDFMKSSGRYGAVAITPEVYSAQAKLIPNKVRASQHTSVWPTLNDKKTYFDNRYEEVSTGDLFVSRYKNQMVAYTPYSYMNPKRNASAEVPMQYNTCQKMGLNMGLFSAALIREYSDKIELYLNNHRTDTVADISDQILIYGATVEPTYSLTKRAEATASATASWQNGIYTLTVSHNGPVDVTINCAGNQTGRREDMLEDAPLTAPTQPARFVGELIIEAEDMNYKNIEYCVDNYYYQDMSIRNHSGNGIIKMGKNTNSGLKTTIKANAAGNYKVAVRYSNTDKMGKLLLTMNSVQKDCPVELTAKNEWLKETLTFHLNEGNNTFCIDNTQGIGLWIDQVIFTPAGTDVEEFDVNMKEASEGGSASASLTKASEGDIVYLTVEPEDGFVFNGWNIIHGKIDIKKTGQNSYQFTMTDDIVTLQPTFKDNTIVYQIEWKDVLTGCLPQGWRTIEQTDNGESIHEYPTVYTGGPRTFGGFSGTYRKGLYWRGGGCSADYGKQADYPLTLKAGDYRLSYVMAGWNGNNKYKAQILKSDGTVLQEESSMHTTTVNAAEKMDADLSAATAETMDFTVAADGNYVIKFQGDGVYPGYLLLSCSVKRTSAAPEEATGAYTACFSPETYNNGWTWNTPVNLSAYKYIVITSARCCANGGSTEIAITDNNGRTISGEDYKTYNTENGEDNKKGMWMDTWNHQQAMYIDLEALANDGFDRSKIKSLTFSGGSYVLGNVFATNKKIRTSVNTWDSSDNEGDYRMVNQAANKYGTICLPYEAAVSCAEVYEIAGKENGQLYINKVTGLLEAGKAYIYKTSETLADDKGNKPAARAFFYRATDAADVAEPLMNNGLVGTFSNAGYVPQGSYILSSNKLYYVNSNVNFAANRAYIDINSVSAMPMNAKPAASFLFDEVTSIDSLDEIVDALNGSEIYGLDGVKRKSLSRGLNIVNGKKIFVNK